MIFVLHQRLMELEQGRRFEDDGKRWDPARIQEERGQTEQKAVAGGQSRGASTGALTDQQLMFQQQGLGGNCADTTGSQEFGKDGQQVNDEEKYFSHALNGTTLLVTHKIAPATKHGLTTLKKAVRVLGGRAIDRRTSLGRALEDWRQSLLSDLGGIEQTSTQQRQIVDLAVKTKLILDSIDVWLLRQPSLVNHRKRMFLPVVLQRQQLADALARYMTQLGLERRAKKTLTLTDYLGGKATPPPAGRTNTKEGPSLAKDTTGEPSPLTQEE